MFQNPIRGRGLIVAVVSFVGGVVIGWLSHQQLETIRMIREGSAVAAVSRMLSEQAQAYYRRQGVYPATLTDFELKEPWPDGASSATLRWIRYLRLNDAYLLARLGPGKYLRNRVYCSGRNCEHISLDPEQGRLRSSITVGIE